MPKHSSYHNVLVSSSKSTLHAHDHHRAYRIDLLALQRARLNRKLIMDATQHTNGRDDLSIFAQLEEMQFKFQNPSISGGEKADMIEKMQSEWNSVAQKLLDACCERK